MLRNLEPGSESGKSCEAGRVIIDLRGANNAVEAGLVGERDGLIVERSLGGDIVVERRWFGRASRLRGCTWWNA